LEDNGFVGIEIRRRNNRSGKIEECITIGIGVLRTSLSIEARHSESYSL
jgi:hypothetical protein